MSIDNGTQLGSYEIVSPLGAGGMGEVYRAKDSKLDREVAIKVLPETFARDPERVVRFQREAKVLASLNHPNIAAIYGFEDFEDKRFLVMELVEGETLSQCIKNGSIDLDDTLHIHKQIAEALAAAHESGIIHRDLKPANVKVTPEGKVKVLDFGLAKAMSGGEDRSHTDIANSPTITANYTRPGVVMGTAAYMSPEQARGKTIDKRSDIWSFGCLLFECLTGQRLFGGDTISDSIGAILHKEPDFTALPANTPPTVQLLLRRCLAKDKNRRLHDIGDARVELEEAITDPTSSSLGLADYSSTRHPRKPIPFAWIAYIVMGSILGLGGSYFISQPSQLAKESVGVVRFNIPLPEQTRVAGWASPVVAISPDGKKIAYVGIHQDKQRLYIHHLDREKSILVPGDEPVEGPFFSPDSQWVVYADGGISGNGSTTQGKLKKVSVDGTIQQTICEIDDYFGATWADDGNIYYSGLQFILRKVPHRGGTPSIAFPEIPIKTKWPQFIPGSDYVIVINQDEQLQSIDLSSGHIQDLGLKANYAIHAPSGHLLFTNATSDVQAVEYDPATRSIHSTGVSVLRDVALGCNSAPALDISNTGHVLYVTGFLQGSDLEPTKLIRVGHDGKHLEEIVTPSQLTEGFSVSNDGKRLAIVKDGVIWIYDLDRETRLKLPAGNLINIENLLWSTDGNHIVFSAMEEYDLYIQPADGHRPPEVLVDRPGEQHAYSWTPDGQSLLFTSSFGPDSGIFLLSMEGKEVNKLLPADGLLRNSMISPSGQLVAYQNVSLGKFEIFLHTFPGMGNKIPVSVDGGINPFWSVDGKEICYLQGNRLMSVSVQAEPDLQLSDPKMLFELDGVREIRLDPGGNGYLVSMREPEIGIQTELHVVLNWIDELKSKVPIGESR